MNTKHISIKIADISNNPYRDLKLLPLEPEKVKILIASIETTSFWENILVRPFPGKPGKFQLAYGHHRLKALKDAGIKESVFIVADIANEQMVQIMANENMQEFGSSLDTIRETIIQVRNYLNDCLTKKHIPNVKTLYPNVDTLRRAEKKGTVGPDAIQRFLGDGWSIATIKRVWKVILETEAKTINAKAVQKFQSPVLAESFVKKMIADKVKPSEQLTKANEILSKTNTLPLSQLLKPRVKANAENGKGKGKGKKEVTSIDTDVNTVITALLSINNKMSGVIAGYKGIDSDKKNQFEKIARKTVEYFGKLNFLQIEKVLVKKANGKRLVGKQVEKEFIDKINKVVKSA